MSQLDAFKEEIMEYTRKQKQNYSGAKEPWDTVTLHYGTTSRHLNAILKNGLKPRLLTNENNFEHVPSNEEMVYLTTKWHYWYAYHANEESLKKSVGEGRYEEEPITKLWNETSDFPMYLTCEVPVESLTLDEDVVYQRDIKKKIREGIIKRPEDITVEDCLEQGTVACLEPLPLVQIDSITILGSSKLRDNLIDGEYGEEMRKWFRGLGTGDLTETELLMYTLHDFHKETEIIEVLPNPDENSLIERIQNQNGTMQIKYK